MVSVSVCVCFFFSCVLKDVQSFVCTRNGCRFYVLLLFVQRLLWNRENKQSEKLKFSVLVEDEIW